MVDGFVESFKQLLKTEFDCSDTEADRIAKHAERHNRNAGVQRAPTEWIELMKEIEVGTAVQRWKTTISLEMDRDDE